MAPEPGARLAIAFGLSAALSTYLTPLVRRGARTFGVMDRPTGPLKKHARPVAYLGGIAIYLAYLLTLSVVFTFDVELLGMLLAGTLMTMLGLFDDLRVLPPTLKLLGQLLAAWVLYRCGVHIQLAFLHPLAAAVLTVLWLVGITNAINILDVSDGLATGCAAVAAAALALMAYHNGNTTLALTALALCGALSGYAPFNWAPASIYLGDTGSLFVGFTLAALSLLAEYTETSPWGALAPVAFLVVPLLDLGLVSVARLRAGKSPLMGSPDHLALRLRAAGWTTPQVARFGIGLSLLGAALGVALTCVADAIAALLAAAGAATYVALGVWLYRKPVPGGPRVAVPAPMAERPAQQACAGAGRT